MPTGLRDAEPLKMTSVIESPRRCFADSSPITQRTASMMFDLPQPLGPTTPVRLLGKSDRGRIGERLESGDFDLGQAHLFFQVRPAMRKNWRRSVK